MNERRIGEFTGFLFGGRPHPQIEAVIEEVESRILDAIARDADTNRYVLRWLAFIYAKNLNSKFNPKLDRLIRLTRQKRRLGEIRTPGAYFMAGAKIVCRESGIDWYREFCEL